jgi:rhamnosyltransferase
MKTDRPLLTIAIPTYGRAPFLRELLACLRPQLEDQPTVELLISDNASPDETAEVVREFEHSGLELRYICNEINIGPDANFLQCYEQAAGRYVWVFGDDDLLLDGGLSTVVKLLEQESPDYMFVAPYVFQSSVAEIKLARRMVPTMVLTDPVEMVRLVNHHTDLILISGAIIDKQYIATLDHPSFASLVGTNVVQLGWVFTALRNLRRGAFLQLGVLASRAGNSRGGFHAAKVFGEGYGRAVSEMLEPGSRLSRKLLADHMRIWFPRNWLQFRDRGEEARNQNQILHRAFGDNPWYWICVWPLLHFPTLPANLWAGAFRLLARKQGELLSIWPGAKSTPNLSVFAPITQSELGTEENPRLAAIIVLYHPDQKLLERLLSSVAPQVHHLVVVDNTPQPDPALQTLLNRYTEQVSYVPLGDNKGIAAAQNRGIQTVMGAGYSHVLLLDQDSFPASNMVHELLVAEAAMLNRHINVAAVGPLFIDEKNGTASKAIRHGWMRVKRIPIDRSTTQPVEADYLISSGSLIRLSMMAEVGLMREELFIDWVDIEWGLRALRMNSKCYVVPSAVMTHSIGDNSVRVLAKDINLHNDTRNYYIVRNAAYLLSLKTMGWKWRSVTMIKIPMYVWFYSWHSPRQRQSFLLLCKAVLDGVRRKVGRLA